MGILTPLFLAALGGLALPLIFHLVRRTPRGKQEFSSLMFLSPTPPRLTRRSRLDQVLLLLMRLAVLALLIFGFARPFLRESSLLSLNDLPRRRVAILLDTSASLHRSDLWQQALTRIGTELDNLTPQDDVALFTFSNRMETVVGFRADAELGSSASPVDVIRQQLKLLKPTWATGDLGTALVTLATELATNDDVRQSRSQPQIVVISDFQQGSRLEALQRYEWPDNVRVIPQPVQPRLTTNATLQLLTPAEDDLEGEPRVRVSNSSASTDDQFFVRWSDAKLSRTAGTPTGAATAATGEVAVYVPPGQSRVVKLPRPSNLLLADRVVLRGDAEDYDNTYFVVPPRPLDVTVSYFGSDKPDDPQGLRYYLELATSGDPLRKITFDVQQGTTARFEGTPRLVVVSDVLSSELQTTLEKYVAQGGTLLLVPRDQAGAEQLMRFAPDLEVISDKNAPSIGTGETPEQGAEKSAATGDSFRLLGEIDFTHPLFAPFANPRYNDFTRIHFWQARQVRLKAAPATGDAPASTTNSPSATRVIARFDDESPWLLERTSGRGRIYALTSGWHPDDSQLAVSSKFVPLIGHLLDQACGTHTEPVGTLVNAPVPLPGNRAGAMLMQLPNGKSQSVPATTGEFRETQLPGIYQSGLGSAGLGDGELRFAVNLDPLESQTAPIPQEALEQLGVRLGTEVTQAERLDQARQARDTELESRQQLWRWLLVGCLCVVILETWWAGRAQQQLQHSPATSPDVT